MQHWSEERHLGFVWEKKCAFPQAPPCKETPAVYIAWERLRPKIGLVSDDLQLDAAFPFFRVWHCSSREFPVKLGGGFRIFARGKSVSRISIATIDWTVSFSIGVQNIQEAQLLESLVIFAVMKKTSVIC